MHFISFAREKGHRITIRGGTKTGSTGGRHSNKNNKESAARYSDKRYFKKKVRVRDMEAEGQNGGKQPDVT